MTYANKKDASASPPPPLFFPPSFSLSGRFFPPPYLLRGWVGSKARQSGCIQGNLADDHDHAGEADDEPVTAVAPHAKSARTTELAISVAPEAMRRISAITGVTSAGEKYLASSQSTRRLHCYNIKWTIVLLTGFYCGASGVQYLCTRDGVHPSMPTECFKISSKNLMDVVKRHDCAAKLWCRGTWGRSCTRPGVPRQAVLRRTGLAWCYARLWASIPPRGGGG